MTEEADAAQWLHFPGRYECAQHRTKWNLSLSIDHNRLLIRPIDIFLDLVRDLMAANDDVLDIRIGFEVGYQPADDANVPYIGTEAYYAGSQSAYFPQNRGEVESSHFLLEEEKLKSPGDLGIGCRVRVQIPGEQRILAEDRELDQSDSVFHRSLPNRGEKWRPLTCR